MEGARLRDHQRTGTEDNDELLGHHGNDKVVGLDGKDVLWGDWELAGNATNQSDVLRGGDGNDFLYPSHGKNLMYGGDGNDRIIAYYGHGLIDCGPGKKDYAQTRWQSNAYRVRNCEHIRHFCAFGSKPNGDCKKPGESAPRRAQPSGDPRRLVEPSWTPGSPPAPRRSRRPPASDARGSAAPPTRRRSAWPAPSRAP